MTKSEIINKAIAEQDLIFVDGVLVYPVSLEGKHLYYQNLTNLYNYGECSGEHRNVDNVEVKSYEEGV